jgi:uncharacterized coiled-coil DUF342 family protein
MLEQADIDKLMSELNALKSELKEYRIKLNGLDRKKEEVFREKRKISSDVYSRIKEAQGYKEKRNNLTDVVKNTKLSKEELEARIKTLDEEIHKLKEEKTKILTKLGVENPAFLKRNIKALEFKIETEGLTFEKEKELMKVLSKMKKQYENSRSVEDIEKKLDSHFRELRDLKEQAEMTRKIVQVSAKESQKHHIELIESSKEIDELKNKEQELEDQIGKLKDEMHKLNEEMNPKMDRLEEVKKILHENNVQLKEDVNKSNSEILRQKDTEVQEKIKTGKKLTTEDLLILQRTMKN